MQVWDVPKGGARAIGRCACQWAVRVPLGDVRVKRNVPTKRREIRNHLPPFKRLFKLKNYAAIICSLLPLMLR